MHLYLPSTMCVTGTATANNKIKYFSATIFKKYDCVMYYWCTYWKPVNLAYLCNSVHIDLCNIKRLLFKLTNHVTFKFEL